MYLIMVTKVAKVEIKRPLNMEKALFYKCMKDIQYQSWLMANEAVRMYWDFQGFDFAYKEKYGEYFRKENGEYPSGNKSFQTDIIHATADKTPALHSNMKDAVVRMVEQKWKNDMSDVLKGNKGIPHFKRDLPIELHNKQFMDSKRNIRIFNEDGKYTTRISLLPKKYAQELGLSDGNIDLELIVKGQYIPPILDRIINGEYKLSMSKMKYDNRKKKWFLYVTYSFEAVVKTLEQSKILGVDVGFNIPAMCAINDSFEFLSVGNRQEIDRFENEIRGKQRELQRSCKTAGEGAVGHGTKRRIKRVEVIGNKIANYKATKNHAFSRAIVNFAIQNQCGTIQMADFTGITDDSPLLKRWTYFDLQQKIINKATEHGIVVTKIPRGNISKRCSSCGFVHLNPKKEDYRTQKETFQCSQCKKELDADINAARNLTVPKVHEVIEKQIKQQQKELRHNLEYTQ